MNDGANQWILLGINEENELVANVHKVDCFPKRRKGSRHAWREDVSFGGIVDRNILFQHIVDTE